MKRNQLVFFLIIGAAVGIIAIGFALQSLSNSDSGNGGDSAPTPRGDPLTIEVAVSTVAESWITDAANAYNATNPRVNGRPVTVRVVRQDSLAVWSGSAGVWSAQNHPVAWIPEANYEVAYANDINLRYEDYQSSLAQTPIIWGAYKSRSDVIIITYGEFNTDTVQQAATAERWEDIGGNSRWQFVKIAFARPNSASAGLATLLTLAGEFGGVQSLDATLMSDAALQSWLTPIINAVPNFSTLQRDPAQVMATRGTSTAELALLPESQWLIHFDELTQVESIQLFYPTYTVVLDFPYTIWNGAETTDDERRAAEDFGDFLMTSDQQRAAGEHGLRPASGGDLTQYAPFRAAEGTVQLALSVTEIAPANRPSTLSLLNWFNSFRTAP